MIDFLMINCRNNLSTYLFLYNLKMSENSNSNNLNKEEKIIDSQITRVLTLFDIKNKYFQIIFYTTLSFALFFLFLSILPSLFMFNESYRLFEQESVITN